jgi:hypothetical protein
VIEVAGKGGIPASARLAVRVEKSNWSMRFWRPVGC